MAMSWVYNRAAAITKSDTVDIASTANGLPPVTDAIYIGTKGSTGTIVAVMQDGTTATFVGLIAGTIYPLRVKRINSGTTDTSDMVALYQT